LSTVLVEKSLSSVAVLLGLFTVRKEVQQELAQNWQFAGA